MYRPDTNGVRAERDIVRSRRVFLRKSALGLAATGLLISGCEDDDDDNMTAAVDLGSGDVGILNYAYALEQLESAFYAAVQNGSYYTSANDNERAILDDLEAHERAHTEFFAAAIASVGTLIPDLEVDFSAIDFSNRNSVLSTAMAFEDLGVSAYNGAGRLLQNPDYLVVAGKIVSVEARHASVIRSILMSDRTAFAGDDIIDDNGLEITRTPAQVLRIASDFITTPINASNLPG